MQQIFDWLREQMQKRIDRCEVNDTPEIEEGRRMYILGKQGGLEKALELVDEAEAKWESECVSGKCYMKNALFKIRIQKGFLAMKKVCKMSTVILAESL